MELPAKAKRGADVAVGSHGGRREYGIGPKFFGDIFPERLKVRVLAVIINVCVPL